MTRTLIVALVAGCIASTASADSLRSSIAKNIHRLGNAFACEVLTGTSSLNKTPQCRGGKTAARVDDPAIDNVADRRSLQECIKPGNLIDEDVRKCMKGL